MLNGMHSGRKRNETLRIISLILKAKSAIICHICIKCLVNTHHVVKTTGVISGAGINNPYGASECIHDLLIGHYANSI
jgi:hypothetical protein